MINVLTSLYILSLVTHVIFTNVKPYVIKNSDFQFENSTSNSISHLGPDMVVGIVTNQVVIMILSKEKHDKFKKIE